MKYSIIVKNHRKFYCILTVLLSFAFACKNKPDKTITKLVGIKLPNGNLAPQGVTVNGKRQGLWIEYDDSGNVSSNYTYVDDSISGDAIHYREDGMVMSMGKVEHEQRQGEWIEY